MSVKKSRLDQKILNEMYNMSIDATMKGMPKPINVEGIEDLRGEKLIKKTFKCSKCDKILTEFYTTEGMLPSGLSVYHNVYCLDCYRLIKLKE